ncbi:SRPBCC family protein [Halodurantibacterium flavum]|uniref:SRPBCC family protein n=1 Tax=Halodurantibacterium flavum TaxID=1382802 RepID=A0ABW4S872_9RHOB
MKFTTTEDLEAPVDAVFRAVADFSVYQRMGERNGVRIERTDRLPQPAAGSSWAADFRYRGKERSAVAELEAFDPPNGLTMRVRSAGIGGVIQADLTELAASRTRIRIDMELEPQSITAKLLVQSLRLARGRAEERYRTRIHRFLREVEARLQRA